MTHYENVARTLRRRTSQKEKAGVYGLIWQHMGVILDFEELLSKLGQYKSLAAGFPDAEQFRIGD